MSKYIGFRPDDFDFEKHQEQLTHHIPDLVAKISDSFVKADMTISPIDAITLIDSAKFYLLHKMLKRTKTELGKDQSGKLKLNIEMELIKMHAKGIATFKNID